MRDNLPFTMAPFRVVACLVIVRYMACRTSAFVPVSSSSRNQIPSQNFRQHSDSCGAFTQSAIFVAKMSNDLPKKKKTKRRPRKSGVAKRTDLNAPVEPRRKKKLKLSDGALYQRREMVNHELLTKEEEFDLGAKIVKAKEVQEAMIVLIEKKNLESSEKIVDEIEETSPTFFSDVEDESYLTPVQNPNAIDDDDLNHMSIHELDLARDEDGAIEFMRAKFLENDLEDGTQRLSEASVDPDHQSLSEKDIISGLNIPGGRAELQQVLLDGAVARDKLIRSNVRLVVSIAKRWAKQTAKHSALDDRLLNLYAASWNRPSLDEAIQEGIVGLARAADRYDPSRGLKFSTYATYWVTSYVRTSYQKALTGCLRVPSKLHDIKAAHSAILKRCYGSMEKIPSEEAIAEEIGISVPRLRKALDSTRTLLSLDAPVATSQGSFKGSKAGGDDMGGNNIMISDTIQCGEAVPEDWVELTFLRQCLENAMATELSPYERDVLRLRLGLDDGVTRTVREVVEVCGGSVSMSDVRNAEQRAFRKLRSPYAVHTYKLLSYLDFAGLDATEAFTKR